MKARISVHRDFKIADIDDRIYSAFLEHLGRAIYAGIYEPGPSDRGQERHPRRTCSTSCATSKLPLVRYPGGNFVSAYNWEDGIGPR